MCTRTGEYSLSPNYKLIGSIAVISVTEEEGISLEQYLSERNSPRQLRLRSQRISSCDPAARDKSTVLTKYCGEGDGAV